MDCEMLADPVIDPVLTEGVMTVRDACRFLSIGRTQLYQLMKSGRLPWVSLGSCRRIPRRAVMQLLADGLVSKS